MNLFDPMKDAVKDAKIVYEGMKKRVKEAKTGEELSGVYCDLLMSKDTYEGMLLTLEPGTNMYRTIKGIRESQKSLMDDIEDRAEKEGINLLS
jgi:hypothetical protein